MLISLLVSNRLMFAQDDNLILVYIFISSLQFDLMVKMVLIKRLSGYLKNLLKI